MADDTLILLAMHVIENQLEGTNHDHLGKIVTYASGLNAKTMVWIVKDAKEEHRAAIEWLNNNTNSDINFFLIEIFFLWKMYLMRIEMPKNSA